MGPVLQSAELTGVATARRGATSAVKTARRENMFRMLVLERALNAVDSWRELGCRINDRRLELL